MIARRGHGSAAHRRTVPRADLGKPWIRPGGRLSARVRRSRKGFSPCRIRPLPRPVKFFPRTSKLCSRSTRKASRRANCANCSNSRWWRFERCTGDTPTLAVWSLLPGPTIRGRWGQSPRALRSAAGSCLIHSAGATGVGSPAASGALKPGKPTLERRRSLGARTTRPPSAGPTGRVRRSAGAAGVVRAPLRRGLLRARPGGSWAVPGRGALALLRLVAGLVLDDPVEGAAGAYD